MCAEYIVNDILSITGGKSNPLNVFKRFLKTFYKLKGTLETIQSFGSFNNEGRLIDLLSGNHQ